MEGANTHKLYLYYKELNWKAKTAKHAFEVLQGELGTMQATLHDVELSNPSFCVNNWA
jgi:hypothetical protein